MRYSSSIYLVSVATAQNDEGAVFARRERRRVFCNERAVGASAWAAARASGLMADAEVEVRSCDYDGQQEAELNGCEYAVERASRKGEFTVLTLGRTVANV